MTARAAERGQPLVMLGVVLAGWIVLRTALWQPPFAELAPVSIRPNAGEAVFATLRGPAPELSASSPPSPREFVLTATTSGETAIASLRKLGASTARTRRPLQAKGEAVSSAPVRSSAMMAMRGMLDPAVESRGRPRAATSSASISLADLPGRTNPYL